MANPTLVPAQLPLHLSDRVAEERIIGSNLLKCQQVVSKIAHTKRLPHENPNHHLGQPSRCPGHRLHIPEPPAKANDWRDPQN